MTKGTRRYDPLPDTYISKRTMLWLIKHLSLLQLGVPPPGASSYLDWPPSVEQAGSQASFVAAVEYAFEVERRLMRAHEDGLILLCIECYEMSEATLAVYFRTTREAITRRSQEALGYVSGYSRKKRNYSRTYQHKRASEV